MVDVEPGLDGEDALEAGEQQAGADEQHERERDLRGHEQRARTARAAPARRAAAPFFAEAWLRFMRRTAEDRDQADEEAGDHARAPT